MPTPKDSWQEEQVELLRSLLAAHQLKGAPLVVMMTIIVLSEAKHRWQFQASYRELSAATHYTLRSVTVAMNELLDGKYLIRLKTGTKKLKYRINVDSHPPAGYESKSLAPLWDQYFEKHRTTQSRERRDDSGSDARESVLDNFDPVN